MYFYLDTINALYVIKMDILFIEKEYIHMFTTAGLS